MVNLGLIIMATGMLVVFAFLAIMVIVMRLMSVTVLRFFPETIKPASAVQNSKLELAIAIAAAHMGR